MKNVRGAPGKKEKENDFKDLFFKFKPVEMLVFLKRGMGPKYATQVSKGVDCTYSHTIKVLEKFKELGLVMFKKRGRIKMIQLTSDGEEIAHDFEGLSRKFDRANSEKKKKKDEKKEDKRGESGKAKKGSKK
ncbi:MAG: MarR family transcriptional regulator [archaeon]|nr:MAG: MarR family transcriptional regulator [archaeon]